MENVIVSENKENLHTFCNLKNLKQGNLKNKKIETDLCMKYNLEYKGIAETVEIYQAPSQRQEVRSN